MYIHILMVSLWWELQDLQEKAGRYLSSKYILGWVAKDVLGKCYLVQMFLDAICALSQH